MSDDDLPSVVDDVIDPVEPLIQTLPPEKKVLIRQIIAHQYQGPLPPPAMMEDYGRIIPDGANRLMNLLEMQTKHRIDMEAKLVGANVSVTKDGQNIAFILSIFFGIIAAVLGFYGHDWLAGTIAVTTIIGLAVVFVLGKEPGRSDDSEAEAKNEPERPSPQRARQVKKRKNP